MACLFTNSLQLSFQVLVKPALEPRKVLFLPHHLARIDIILLHMNEEMLVCFELGSTGFLWPLCPVLKKGKSNSSLSHGCCRPS